MQVTYGSEDFFWKGCVHRAYNLTRARDHVRSSHRFSTMTELKLITHKLRSLSNSFSLHAGNPFGQLDGCRYASRSAPPAKSRTRGRRRRASYSRSDGHLGLWTMGALSLSGGCGEKKVVTREPHSLPSHWRLVLSDQRAASRPLRM